MTDLLAGMQQQAPDDPLMAMLMQQFADRAAQPAVASREEQLESRLERARHVIARLRARAEAADRMADFVAETLGACASCWGLVDSCGVCGGAGSPGWTTPVRDRLVEWIAPAFARAGVPLAVDSAPPPPHETERKP